MRPKRSDDKYWTGTSNFNHIQYEMDLEDYIDDMEAKDVPPESNITIPTIPNGTKVTIRSGDRLFDGIIEKSEWDFDQWSYFVSGEWFCQSEVCIP